MTEIKKIGGVIVSHGRVANELLAAAETVVGHLSHIAAVSIGWHDDVEAAKEEISRSIKKVSQGRGVLLLTDMFGGTPTNISAMFIKENEVEVITERAEAIGQSDDHRERYDRVFARALAPLAVLAEYCLPCARAGGLLVAPKKAGIDAELTAARRAIQLLGGAPPRLTPYRLPGLDEKRLLVVVEKISPTPAEFPRRPGVPAKRPLR